MRDDNNNYNTTVTTTFIGCCVLSYEDQHTPPVLSPLRNKFQWYSGPVDKLDIKYPNVIKQKHY